MEDKPTYYAIIPAVIRYDEDLKPNEKLLYGEITALTNKTGVCFAKNDYFAQLYGVTTKSIKNWIKNLRDKGYIKTLIQYKKGTKEVKCRAIIINGTPIVGKINTFSIGKTPRKESIPDWLGKEIEEDTATPEEMEELMRLLEQ